VCKMKYLLSLYRNNKTAIFWFSLRIFCAGLGSLGSVFVGFHLFSYNVTRLSVISFSVFMTVLFYLFYQLFVKNKTGTMSDDIQLRVESLQVFTHLSITFIYAYTVFLLMLVDALE